MCKIPQFNVIYILQPAECNIQLLFNNIIKNRQEHLGFPAVQGAGIFLTVRLRLLGAYFLHFSLTVSKKESNIKEGQEPDSIRKEDGNADDKHGSRTGQSSPRMRG